MRKGTRFLLVVFGFTGSNLHNLWVSNLVTDIAQPQFCIPDNGEEDISSYAFILLSL